ncbi:hypothetical protein ZIOFF_056776 [Zingiber officinale]|uniref:Nuclear cap-binding protein subunit 2 n=1 Tax=Zingiber officinale TaxID=94328 RepID=A0A8J5FMK4_ZINOF|nr:hypothetical protein ZIOFF_056776 [Zingiber officinale]
MSLLGFRTAPSGLDPEAPVAGLPCAAAHGHSRPGEAATGQARPQPARQGRERPGDAARSGEKIESGPERRLTSPEKGEKIVAVVVTQGKIRSREEDLAKLSAYRDRRFHGNQEEYERALQASTTVYVGNMSFYSTEEQVYELFSRAGEIKKIIMGLDKNTKTPCGFSFVLYYSREDAEDAVKYISGTMLDDRLIRVDFDWGFEEGRQWGRGRSGGQVRDEYRTDYDPDIL